MRRIVLQAHRLFHFLRCCYVLSLTVPFRHILYGSEESALLKSDLSSLDFVIVCFLMKLFNTNNKDIIDNCRQYFHVKLPNILWSDCASRFKKKSAECNNIFGKTSASVRWLTFIS